MGKKSKKGAAAKATGGAKPAGGGAAAVESGGGTGTAGIPARCIARQAKQRCVECWALLKDLAKAHQCPGCSQLFCWRCEKKCFGACPNGEQCVSPRRRCFYCFGGKTMESTLGSSDFTVSGTIDHLYRENDSIHPDLDSIYGQETHTVDIRAFRSFLHSIQNDQESRLTRFAVPFQLCQSDGCRVNECHECEVDPTTSTRLISCATCLDASCKECAMKTRRVLKEDLHRMRQDGFGADCMVRAVKSAGTRGLYFDCATCKKKFCLGCSIEPSAPVELIRNIIETRNRELYCLHCYWKSKPCTNPTCPNEVGVPTKRCGGCHLDRYCSVECQATAYPQHMRKCHKIQAKRAAIGKVEEKE